MAKKYEIYCDIKEVSGYQCYTVEAEAEAEALKKYNDGYADFDHEQVDIISLSEPELYEIKDD